MGALAEKFIGSDPVIWHPLHFDAPENRAPELQLSADDKQLIAALNSALESDSLDDVDLEKIERLYQGSSLPQRFYRLFFVLYSPSKRRILISRKYENGKWTFAATFNRLLKHARRDALVKAGYSLQIDFVEVPPTPLRFYHVGMISRGPRHFELGVEGIIIEGEDKNVHYYLPGDAYVRSIMGMGQLRDYFNRLYTEEYLRKSTFQRFRTKSFLLKDGHLHAMYRGLPAIGALTKEKLESVVHNAIEHIKLTQEPEGKFLYYYDPVLDSRRDWEHPGRDPDKNPYYNILRHSGGGLTCIYHEKYTQKRDTLGNIQAAIEYLKESARYYEVNGETAAYIYSEKKAKLGGAGIGLYFVAEYILVTGDDKYQDFADALAWHLLHQITDSGEFIYYNVYLDKEVTAKENNQYFSFYYPGEALCGLGKYLHTQTDDRRSIFFSNIKKAMNYLLNIRPTERASEYTQVPSDSWLMMGVKELWDYEEMQDPAWADWVFSDARKMIDQMYKVTDSPYPDYAGAFYYNYGDYPYADGARLEGLMGAYELAHKMQEKEVMRHLWPALRLGAWSIMHLANSAAAIYPAKKPELAIGGIRFKYTRQWFRIDTIQHVACFSAKLLPYWDEGVELFDNGLTNESRKHA